MPDSEKINGQDYGFAPDTLLARDDVVNSYKPLLPKIRQFISKEIETLPERMVLVFVTAWMAWEGMWLRDREHNAVAGLQLLAKALLSLGPFLESRRKEALQAFPRNQAQKVGRGRFGADQS